MAYLDISCPNCGSFSTEGKRRLSHCPQCRSTQAIILPHDYEIDGRFREERQRKCGADFQILCPQCRSIQAIILPHDYEIDGRFR